MQFHCASQGPLSLPQTLWNILWNNFFRFLNNYSVVPVRKGKRQELKIALIRIVSAVWGMHKHLGGENNIDRNDTKRYHIRLKTLFVLTKLWLTLMFHLTLACYNDLFNLCNSTTHPLPSYWVNNIYEFYIKDKYLYTRKYFAYILHTTKCMLIHSIAVQWRVTVKHLEYKEQAEDLLEWFITLSALWHVPVV